MALPKTLVRVLRSAFVRSVALLAGGTLVGQIILIVASPILTRLYTPSEMGLLGLYLTFVNLAAFVVMLRYEGAIVSAQDDREAAFLVLGGLLLAAVSSPVLALLLWGMIRGQWLGFGELDEITALLAVPALWLAGLFAALRYWLIRQGEFGVITSVMVAQNAARATAQIGLGLLHLGWPGLIGGELVGRATGVLRMIRASWTALRSHPLEWDALRQVLLKYRKFPLYSAPSSLLDSLGSYIAIPLLATYYGTAAAGHFSLVLRLIAVPSALIGGSVGDVFHQRMADYRQSQPNRAPRFFLQTAGGLLALSLMPALVLALFGPALFELVFSAEWRTAGEMAAAMSLWLVGQIAVGPLTRVVFIYQGQELKLIYDVVSLSVSVAAFPLASAYRLPASQAVAILSLGNALAYVLYFGLLWRMVTKAD